MGTQERSTTSRLRIGSLAIAALAAGGVSAAAIATGPAGATANKAAKTVLVTSVKSAKFGKVLTSGKTLYTLMPSGNGCTGACLKVWPALILPKGVTKPKVGSGVTASKLGTMTIAGGAQQVTYNGKPLYSFVGDKASGQVNGNVTDSFGKWTAVVTAKPAKSNSGSNSGGSTAGSGGTSF